MVHLSSLQFGIQPRNAHCTGRALRTRTAETVGTDTCLFRPGPALLCQQLPADPGLQFIRRRNLRLRYAGDGRALRINTTVTPAQPSMPSLPAVKASRFLTCLLRSPQCEPLNLSHIPPVSRWPRLQPGPAGLPSRYLYPCKRPVSHRSQPCPYDTRHRVFASPGRPG